MSLTTVVYCTSNQEKPAFEEIIRSLLLHTIGDLPLVSVSQKPLPAFGLNVCVGEVGASYRNLYRQMLIGAQKAETDFVATAEADCLYPPGYFDLEPAEPVVINDNLWTLRHFDPGHFRRKGASDGLLFARRDLLIERLEERLATWPGFGPGKVRCPFRPEDYLAFTSLPVINVKTGASIHPGSAYTGGLVDELPHWGAAADWSRTLGLVEAT